MHFSLSVTVTMPYFNKWQRVITSPKGRSVRLLLFHSLEPGKVTRAIGAPIVPPASQLKNDSDEDEQCWT